MNVYPILPKKRHTLQFEFYEIFQATSLGQRRPTYIRQKTIKDQKTVTEDATQSESDSNGAAEDDNDEPDSDAEIEYLNVLCGDEPDIDCYDFQDEEDNFDKILIYARES